MSLISWIARELPFLMGLVIIIQLATLKGLSRFEHLALVFLGAVVLILGQIWLVLLKQTKIMEEPEQTEPSPDSKLIVENPIEVRLVR